MSNLIVWISRKAVPTTNDLLLARVEDEQG